MPPPETTLTVFIGEDRQFPLTVYTTAAQTVVREITGWTVDFVVRRRDDSTGTALLDLTGSVSGTFDADPDTNTQVATATLSRANTLALPAGTYRYSFGRTDTGARAILAVGDLVVKSAAGR